MLGFVELVLLTAVVGWFGVELGVTCCETKGCEVTGGGNTCTKIYMSGLVVPIPSCTRVCAGSIAMVVVRDEIDLNFRSIKGTNSCIYPII